MRIIRLLGDRVDIRNGKVYINDLVLTEKYIEEPPQYNWDSTKLTPNGVIPPDFYIRPIRNIICGQKRTRILK